MDLPWKRHFGIFCHCGAGCAVEVTREQAAMGDPVAIHRSLPEKDKTGMAEFYAAHKAMGHEPAPDLVDFAPMPQA